MINQIVLFFVMLCSLAVAAEFPPKDFTELSSVESASAGFRVIHYKKDANAYDSESQIWVHALKPEFKDQLLFTHNNRSSVLISEDEEYIAINHHELSGLGNLYIFKHNANGGFDEVKLKFLETIKQQVKKRLKLDETDIGFDHEYCYADYWMRDGLLLGHLEGDLSGEYRLRDWYFIYDVRRNRFVSNLSQVNKGTYADREWVPRR